jgi:SAM-dependent methyltransferase
MPERTDSLRERSLRCGVVFVEFTDPRLVAAYDTLNPYEADAQPGFYGALAAELGAETIVDLGCGTGVITCELAGRGFRMIGVEPAPAMLEQARRRLCAGKVVWIDGGAVDIGTPNVDLAIMTGHVAQFFLTDNEWQAALVGLHAALRPGGHLAFESGNPGAREWEQWTHDQRRTVHDAVAGPITTWLEVHDASNEVVTYTIHHEFATTGEHVIAPSALRFRCEADLARSLGDAGFAVERVYGDWDRRPASQQARELIVVARRVD